MTDNIKPNIDTEYLTFQILEKSKIGVCTAKIEYIPIDHFKETFEIIGDLIVRSALQALIFDKSQLNTFHQASMEWYYTTWKKGLAERGLNRHYKILPSLNWFKTSVDAGKHEIKRNNPDFDFSLFTVTYVNNVEEVIEIESKL